MRPGAAKITGYMRKRGSFPARSGRQIGLLHQPTSGLLHYCAFLLSPRLSSNALGDTYELTSASVHHAELHISGPSVN